MAKNKEQQYLKYKYALALKSLLENNKKQKDYNYLLASADELEKVIRTITDKTIMPPNRPTQGE